MLKRHPYHLTIISKDEITGAPETFHLPDAALYFGTRQARLSEEMKLERIKERICLQAYNDFDRSDVLIHDLDDKIRVVHHLRRSGSWAKVLKHAINR